MAIAMPVTSAMIAVPMLVLTPMSVIFSSDCRRYRKNTYSRSKGERHHDLAAS